MRITTITLSSVSFAGVMYQWGLANMKERQLVSVPLSTLHTVSAGSYVIVAETANLKMCVYGLPNAKLSYI